MTNDSINVYKGLPIDILVRINPEENESLGIRVFDKKITLMDMNNKRTINQKLYYKIFLIL